MPDRPSQKETDRGRSAEAPSDIPMKGMQDVFWRIVECLQNDRVTLVAAGVTYYLVLAIFPGLAVLVSLYGLVFDPSDIVNQLAFVRDLLPAGGYELLRPQLEVLAAKGKSELSLAFAFSLLITLWSATNGVKALFEAMNVAYQEAEKRSFVKINMLAISFTIAGLIAMIFLIVVIGVLPAVISFLYPNDGADVFAQGMRWPLLLMLTTGATMVIYRYGPSREPARLRWLTWGAGFSTCIWVLMTLAFSVYLLNFADYDATYGTLGALIGLMVWIWLSIVILIVGAELNAELEHQTRRDSTTGAPKPMGERGAVVADTLGPSSP